MEAPTASSSTHYQYRSLEQVYLLKLKEDQYLTLKIYDLSQNCLYKEKFMADRVDLCNSSKQLTDHKYTLVLESMLRGKESLLPKVKQFTTSKKCLRKLQNLAREMTSKIALPSKELEKYICPITLSLFQEPVIDEHGHTF